MINRGNFEIWFLDFFERNLSKQDISVLYDFLDNNQDLKKEFDDFELMLLSKEDVIYDKKDNLKQNLDIDTIAELDEFETLAVKDLEGEINQTEKAELNSILRFSDEKKKEFRAFNRTILTPEKDLFFKNKENLKRKPGFVVSMWVKFAVSSAAILLIIFFVKNINTGNYKNPDNDINITKNNQKHVQNSKTIVVNDIPVGTSIKENKIEQDNIQKEENGVKLRVLTKKELKKEKNSIVSVASVSIKISLPDNTITPNVEKLTPVLKPVNIVDRKQNKIFTIPEKSSLVEALTPKEFLIRTVKKKLDIDDRNYDNINPVELASASLEKLKIAKVDYRENPQTKKKFFALNIKGFAVERSWVSN